MSRGVLPAVDARPKAISSSAPLIRTRLLPAFFRKNQTARSVFTAMDSSRVDAESRSGNSWQIILPSSAKNRLAPCSAPRDANELRFYTIAVSSGCVDALITWGVLLTGRVEVGARPNAGGREIG